MDTAELVEGGAAGLEKIVAALEAEGIPIVGAYLSRTTATNGFQDTTLRIVTDEDGREVLYKYVRLRRDGLLPRIADEISMTPVRPNHVEASRVLDYARQIGERPVTIRGVQWRGLYIEDAVVVKYPAARKALA
jgi:hypothetical protein